MKQTWQTFNPGLLTPHRHRPFRAHPGHHPLAIEMEGLGKKNPTPVPVAEVGWGTRGG